MIMHISMYLYIYPINNLASVEQLSYQEVYETSTKMKYRKFIFFSFCYVLYLKNKKEKHK